MIMFAISAASGEVIYAAIFRGYLFSFFLSAGELQAPCTKENEFPESVRRRKAEGFSPHRTNTPMVPWCCLAALLPPQHQGSMATAFP